MTQDEYLQQVVPVLKEYKDFLKKNKFFVQVNYGSIPEWSYPELVEIRKAHGKVGFLKFNFSPEMKMGSTSYIRTEDDLDKQLERSWEEQSGDNVSKEAPFNVIEKKREYVERLKNFFGVPFFENSIGDADVMKTNKRVIKYAIDNNIYKELLDSKKITIEELTKIAESAGVRIPAKLTDENKMRMEKAYDEISKKMPSVNRKILTELVESIKKSFEPVAKEIYKREVARYKELATDIVNQQKISPARISAIFDFYEKVFEYNIEKVEIDSDSPKREKIYETYFVGLKLKPDYVSKIEEYVEGYVERLKAEFINAILSNFDKITLPISDFTTLSLKLGAKGLQGKYAFVFNNGSRFNFKTQAIYAGGYNIQRLHLRYLSDFLNVYLENGEEISNPSLAKIIELFSDKSESEKVFNPYVRLQNAQTIDEIAEILYVFLKDKAYYKNVRKSLGKDDASVTFMVPRMAPDYYKREFKFGIYIRRQFALDKAKEMAKRLLIEAKAEMPKYFKESQQISYNAQLIADLELLLGMADDPQEREEIIKRIEALK